MDIKVGDHVELNSGSPALLVVGLDGDSVKVGWKNGIETQLATFPSNRVRKIAAQSNESANA